uniref:Uncharacterized protein n=1 Tax=Apteryx owenii TaxID=8824 RepID=A0A8B9NUR8_APTOW
SCSLENLPLETLHRFHGKGNVSSFFLLLLPLFLLKTSHREEVVCGGLWAQRGSRGPAGSLPSSPSGRGGERRSPRRGTALHGSPEALNGLQEPRGRMCSFEAPAQGRGSQNGAFKRRTRPAPHAGEQGRPRGASERARLSAPRWGCPRPPALPVVLPPNRSFLTLSFLLQIQGFIAGKLQAISGRLPPPLPVGKRKSPAHSRAAPRPSCPAEQ